MTIKLERTSEDGRPRVDAKLCTVCGLCAAVCPSGTLRMGDDGVLVDPDTDFGCIACGQCMAICPSGAVTVSGRGLSVDDRLPLPAASEMASDEQLGALLIRRRSRRHFDDREVPRAVLERVIELASTAPIGVPPSEVRLTVFHGRDKVREFAADVVGITRRGMPTLRFMAGPLMRPLIGKAASEMFRTFVIPLAETITAEADRGRDVLLYDAPAAILFSQPAYGEADADIVATYAMLAAESLGLGTCMIGSASPFLVRDKALLAKYGLPAKPKLGLVLVMGYARYPKFHYGVRRSLADVNWV